MGQTLVLSETQYSILPHQLFAFATVERRSSLSRYEEDLRRKVAIGYSIQIQDAKPSFDNLRQMTD